MLFIWFCIKTTFNSFSFPRAAQVLCTPAATFIIQALFHQTSV